MEWPIKNHQKVSNDYNDLEGRYLEDDKLRWIDEP